MLDIIDHPLTADGSPDGGRIREIEASRDRPSTR